MSDHVFSCRAHTAKKRYRCDASEQWLISGYSADDCKTEEQRAAVMDAEADGWQILVGQKYLRRIQVYQGDFRTFRTRPDMDAVCNELELWDE
jgi:uncharacterized heparinase superfamily protein